MKDNVLVIRHHNNEEEIFEMVNPQYNLHNKNDDVWEFTICFENTKPIKRAKELEEIIDANISFEITSILQKDNIKLEEGKTMFQKESYDYDRKENLSNFYYFEHYDIIEVKIEIVKVHKEYLILNINAKTLISNYSDNKPDADLIINNGKFTFSKEVSRSVQ